MFISPDDARTLSVSLFEAMATLAHADAHFHSLQSAKAKAESLITTTLLHASQVAHSLCESALARVEPFYDTSTESTVAVAVAADDSASCLCRSVVTSALERACTVATALEYASKNCLVVSLPLSYVCGDEAMHAAIDAGDLGAISLAVALLSQLSVSPSPQLLHSAMRNTSIESAVIARIARVLLTLPVLTASANDADADGNTTLMVASAYARNEAVAVLLACPQVAQFADAVNRYGHTALIFASGHAETVAALLECPTVIQSAAVVNQYGYTALMTASFHGCTEAVVALLACPEVMQSAGAVNANGDTALMLASTYGRRPTVTALLACPEVVQSACAVDKRGYTALMLASVRGYSPTVTALLVCSVVVQSACAVDKRGYTALMLASERGHTETVAALLVCPNVVQSIGTVNENGSTALLIAQRNGNNALIALLSSFDVVA
jgi:ankyrin repeat protein